MTPRDGCRAEVLPGGQQKHQGQVEMGQGLLGPHLGPQGWRWTSGDLQNLPGGNSPLIQHCLSWFTDSCIIVVRVLHEIDLI